MSDLSKLGSSVGILINRLPLRLRHRRVTDGVAGEEGDEEEEPLMPEAWGYDPISTDHGHS